MAFVQNKMNSNDNNEAANTTNLLQCQAQAYNSILGYIDSMALKCAVQLGILDIIHNNKSISLSNLVQSLRIPPTKSRHLHRLMRILVHSNFFSQTEGDEYSLTTISTLLLKNQSLLHLLAHPALLTPWEFLSSWFHSDKAHENPFEMAHGKSFWGYVGDESKFQKTFYEAMEADSEMIASIMVKECGKVFEGLNSLVDVGGGKGTMAKAIKDAFPKIECVLFDLPDVVAISEGVETLNVLGGDMFEEIPPANAVFLKWILHDWSDEECIKILKQCKKAIPSKADGGKVIIVDVVLTDPNKQQETGNRESTHAQLLFDMVMMVNLTGAERDKQEWEKLFLEAGFSGYKIVSLLGLKSLIEVYP